MSVKDALKSFVSDKLADSGTQFKTELSERIASDLDVAKKEIAMQMFSDVQEEDVSEAKRKGPPKIDPNNFWYRKQQGKLTDAEKKEIGADADGKRKIKNMKARDKRRAAKGLREENKVHDKKEPKQSDAAWELELFAENEYSLYRQKESIQKNLSKRWKKGQYDSKLAAKLWTYWMDNAAKAYVSQMGTENYPNIGKPAVRKEAAVHMEWNYRQELEIGNFTG